MKRPCDFEINKFLMVSNSNNYEVSKNKKNIETIGFKVASCDFEIP